MLKIKIIIFLCTRLSSFLTYLPRQPRVRLAAVGWDRHCEHNVANTKHCEHNVANTKTMTCTWEHNRWPQDCEHNGANTKTLRTQCGQYKTGDLHVGSQPMAAGCNRRCRLSFYHAGKGASVGERPTRLHFLEATGEKFSLHSTVRLRSLPWIRIAMWSNFSKDCLAWAASSELSNCADSTTKRASVFAVAVTRAC